MRLTADQHTELQSLRHDPSLSPADRDRVEMVALSSAGWAVPPIARHLGYHPETVRRLFRRFPSVGFAAVRHRPPGPGTDRPRRERVQAALGTLLDRPRSWTAAQLAEALRDHGISLSARQTRRHLRRTAAWRRTQRTLSHKQDPVRVAQARAELRDFGGARSPAR